MHNRQPTLLTIELGDWIGFVDSNHSARTTLYTESISAYTKSDLLRGVHAKVALLDTHPDVAAVMTKPPLLATVDFTVPPKVGAPLRVMQGIRISVEGAACPRLLQLRRD
jgi:hypothetical protein